jgi:hypothetical protein
MTAYPALTTAITTSLILSTATVSLVHAPLRKLLEAVCPLGATADFWLRAAMAVSYLLPLWAVLAFGVPTLEHIEMAAPGEVMRRSLASASFALVVIVATSGLRLSTLRPSTLRPATGYVPPPLR